MNEDHIASGRKEQKLKTRNRILKAAHHLVQLGKDISLESVAQQADISRATIYRYYSNIESLSTELVLHLNLPNTDEIFEKLSNENPKSSLLEIQKSYLDFILANEKASKKFLGAILSSSDSKLERGQNRITTLKEFFAKNPSVANPETTSKLINLMVLLMGVESIIATKDVCGLNNKQSIETLQWGLEMILKGCEIQ